MKLRKLGRAGVMVGEIGMGTEHLLDKDERVVIDTVRAAIDGGVTYFDCHPGHDMQDGAESYIGYEKLGKAIEGARDGLCLTYLAGAGSPPEEAAPRFANYLKAMRMDHTDVFILQFCDKLKDFERITGRGGLLEYARRLKSEGRIRHIGLSTHSSAVAYAAVDDGGFDVIMYPVNPAFDVLTDERGYMTDNLETLWDAAHDFDAGGVTGAQPRKSVYVECERGGVAVVAMKPFAGGFIFNVEKDAGFTPVNLIAYALAQNGVAAVVPGCTNPDEIREILTHNSCSDAERDYSGAVAKSRWSVMENCLYCNHCLPCSAGINIGQVNRLLDAVLLGEKPDMGAIKEAYARLDIKASDCVRCGVCIERCPFKVDVINRMERAHEILSI